MTYFPWLYHRDDKGIHMWWVCPEDGQLKITYGIVGKYHKTIFKKKTGKSLDEQAACMWRDMVDKGYLMATEPRENFKLKPMLSNSYKYYPYALDGVVCFQPLVRGERLLVEFGDEGEFLDVCLCDGISYAFDYFKLTELDRPFIHRYEQLLTKTLPPNVEVVEMVKKHSRDVDFYYEKYLKEGHEGVVLRKPTGKYLLDRRSMHCIYKKRECEIEVEIVGVERSEDGTPTWLCEDDDMNEYQVKSVDCSWEERGAMIGKKISIPK